MTCTCGKSSNVKLSYTQSQYCKGCFLKMVLHRVKKDLRQRKVLKPRETVYLLKDGSKEWFVAKWLLEEIFEKRLKVKEVKKLPGKGKRILPWNLEREIKEKIGPFLTGKKAKKDDKIKLPRNLLEEEIVEACKALGYKKIKKDPEHELIGKMEKLYPGTKFGLYRALHEISQQ